jgi:hypothetical protein
MTEPLQGLWLRLLGAHAGYRRAQFKKPVQIFAVLFIQLAGFDQELVNRGNGAAVFLVFPALA